MIEQELKIVAVDGNSFSGKTTLIKEMGRRYPYSMLNEYNIYAGGGQNFPKFPPTNYSEAKEAVDYFVELEKRRSADAVNNALRTKKGLLMDRSFYAVINFQFIVKNTMPQTPNSYHHSIEAFLMHTQKQDIIIPPVLIYLKPENSDVMRKRVARRGRVSIDFLNDPSFLGIMGLWYCDLINNCYTDSNGVVITSLENKLDLNVEEADGFIQSANFLLDRMAIISRFEGELK